MLCHETQWTTKTTFIQNVCIIYSSLNVKITKKYAYSSPIISKFWKPESIIRNILQANSYRPQRSWGKVLFSHTSVILTWQGGAWPGGHAGGHAWQGCVHGGGACMAGRGHAWAGAACVAGGHAWGVCMAGGVHGRGGMHDMHAPRADTTATTYGQWADGTHPTGMHSCTHSILQVINFRQDIRIQTDTPWIMLP